MNNTFHTIVHINNVFMFINIHSPAETLQGIKNRPCYALLIKGAIHFLTASIKGSNIVDLKTNPNVIFPAGKFPVVSVNIYTYEAGVLQCQYMVILNGNHQTC